MGLPEDGELDRRLRSADPMGAGLAQLDDVGRLISELASAVVHTEAASEARSNDTTTQRLGTSRRRQRTGPTSVLPAEGRSARRRVAVAGLAAAALLGTAAFTFGDHLARTGLFGPAGMTENDTSEWLNTGASDFRQVVESLRPTDIPLPAGRDWQPVIDSQVANGQREAALMQVTGVRATFADYAICVWDGEWLAARQAGDTDRSGQAVAVMRGMASWPIIVAVDGGGVRDYLRDVAEAASRGDDALARQHIAANCDSEWIGVGQ